MPELDLATVDRLLTTTRAVRKRLDLSRPVEREVVLDCLRLATQAPTGSNLQTWRWLVVTDPVKRRAIADAYGRAFQPYITLMTALGDPNNEQMVKVTDSASYLAEILPDVPVHVIPCSLGRPDGTGVRGVPVQGWSNGFAAGFYGSIFPAVWSFMLALRSRGLGSVLTTLHLTFEEEVAGLLGIPDTVTQVGLIPVAYFTGDDFRPARRRRVEEITYWDEWKNVHGSPVSVG